MKYVYEKYKPEIHGDFEDWRRQDLNINSFVSKLSFPELLKSCEENNAEEIDFKDTYAYKGEILVVKHEGEIIAFFGYLNYCHFNHIFGNRLRIQNIVINPNFKRQGHGQRIIEEIIKNADKFAGKKIHNIFALVDNENIPSLSLFEKLGFKLSENRKIDDASFKYLRKSVRFVPKVSL